MARNVCEVLLDVFANACESMRSFGNGDFLYDEADVLFAHGHRRVYEDGREYTEPKPPRLHARKRWTRVAQDEIHRRSLNVKLRDQQTVPLDEQGWEPMSKGASIAVKNDQIVKAG